jgi:hypothetical protein
MSDHTTVEPTDADGPDRTASVGVRISPGGESREEGPALPNAVRHFHGQ